MSSFLKRLSTPGIYISAIAFSLPLWPQATIALAGCWLLVCFRQIPSRLMDGVQHPFYRWNALLFLSLLIGLAWTGDLASGWKELKDESYLLVFVLLFAGASFPTEVFQSGRKALVTGSLVASIACMAAAAFRYIQGGSVREFFYTSYSLFLHPTYFGFLLLISCLFLLDQIRLKSAPQSWIPYWSLLVCLGSIAFLCSKVIYAGLIVTGMFGLSLLWIRKKYGILTDRRLQLVAVVGALIILVVNLTNNRLDQVVHALTENKADSRISMDSTMVDSSKYNSTTIRLAQWKYAIELGTEQSVFGSGTGDEVSALQGVFRKHNDPYALLHFKHPHSHYLHYWLMLGYAGLLLALAVLFVPLVLAWRTGNFVLFLFYLLLILVGLTDLLTHATLGACFTFLSCFLFAEAENRRGNFND